MSVLFLSALLAGCISIPLGDGGTVELSRDGVSIENGEEKESEVEESETPETPDSEEELEGLADKGDIETPEAVESEESATEEQAVGTGSCQEPIEDLRGNERAIKQLVALTPPDFPILDCTNVGSVNESYSTNYEAVIVQFDFIVEGYWADIYDLYEAYFEEAGFGPLKKKEQAKEMSASLGGKTPDYDASFYVNQVNNEDIEIVKVSATIYHYDTPQE